MTARDEPSRLRLGRFLLLGAAFVVLVAETRAAAPVMGPLLLPLFITVFAAASTLWTRAAPCNGTPG